MSEIESWGFLGHMGVRTIRPYADMAIFVGGSRSPHVTSVPLFSLANGSHGAWVKSEPSLESEAVNAGS